MTSSNHRQDAFLIIRPLGAWVAFFFYVRAIRFAFLNSRRDKSKCSDFALTKTCDETGRLTTSICLLLCAATVCVRG